MTPCQQRRRPTDRSQSVNRYNRANRTAVSPLYRGVYMPHVLLTQPAAVPPCYDSCRGLHADDRPIQSQIEPRLTPTRPRHGCALNDYPRPVAILGWSCSTPQFFGARTAPACAGRSRCVGRLINCFCDFVCIDLYVCVSAL